MRFSRDAPWNVTSFMKYLLSFSTPQMLSESQRIRRCAASLAARDSWMGSDLRGAWILFCRPRRRPHLPAATAPEDPKQRVAPPVAGLRPLLSIVAIGAAKGSTRRNPARHRIHLLAFQPVLPLQEKPAPPFY